jgi:hypothetical protein
MTTFDVVVTPLLFHVFDVFLVGTTVGGFFSAILAAVALAVAPKLYAALMAATADARFEVSVVGKVRFLCAIDGRRCMLSFCRFAASRALIRAY